MKGNITQRLFLAVSCLFFQGTLWGQTQKIHTLEMNDGTLSGSVVMNADALIDMQSSKKGLLLPRVALVDAKKPAPLTAHTAGMTVYNTATITSTASVEGVTPGYYYNNGTKWVRLTTEVEAEWKDGTVSGTNLIYANQAKIAGNDVVITDDGKVGIGTAAPLAKLHLVIDNLDGGVKNDLLIDEYKNISDWTPITMEHFRGTPDNPEPLQNGDVLGGILDHVYLSDGSIINRAAGIRNIYTGDGSNNLGKMIFFTSDVERMSITDDGNVGIGIITPTQNLEVSGNVSVGKFTVGISETGTNVEGSKLLLGGAVDNSDELYMQRYNKGDNISNFRVVAGDDAITNQDAFEVGFLDYTDNRIFKPSLSVYSKGVGVGTTTPTAKLDIQSTNQEALNIGNGTTTNLKILNDGRILYGYDDPANLGAVINLRQREGDGLSGINISADDIYNDVAASMSIFAGNGAGRISVDKSFYLILDKDNNTSNAAFRIFKDGTSIQGSIVSLFSFSENGQAYKSGGGSWSVLSDKRAKENIKDYTKGLEELLQVRPVNFNYKKEFSAVDDKTYTGVVAQELEKVVPTMVAVTESGNIKDFKIVDPNEFTYMLINSVKELKKQNDVQQQEIEELKTLVNQLLNK